MMYGAYFVDQESITHMDASLDVAEDEIRCEIDNTFEAGEEVEYCTAKMIPAHDVVRKINAWRIGDQVFEWVADDVSEEIVGDYEKAITLEKAQVEQLGALILDYIATHGKSKWWTVDRKTEQKHRYVAGSAA